MKKLIALVILLTLLMGIYISPIGAFAKEKVHYALTPCDSPITYRINEVDPKFHITKAEFTKKVQDAADLWNNAYGKTLFTEDPKGKISINLTYDGRQSINEEVNKLEEGITTEKGTLEERQNEFERRSSEFDTRVTKLNENIAYWNSNGGAPQDEYQKLVDEQNSLRAEAQALNNMAKTLNESTSSFNSQVRELNQSIDTFNQALHEKPEEGVYSEGDRRIDIFFNTNDNTLIRTIAHELGHARGLNHVLDRNAVMYEKTFPEYTLKPDDLKELEIACRKRTPQEAFTESFRSLVLDFKAAK